MLNGHAQLYSFVASPCSGSCGLAYEIAFRVQQTLTYLTNPHHPSQLYVPCTQFYAANLLQITYNNGYF
jgi:hypothetical protein